MPHSASILIVAQRRIGLMSPMTINCRTQQQQHMKYKLNGRTGTEVVKALVLNAATMADTSTHPLIVRGEGKSWACRDCKRRKVKVRHGDTSYPITMLTCALVRQ